MNFVHVSDTHIGGANFKLKQREDDFLDVFRQVINYCLKEKPEFVIHSGDLFDKGRPGNRFLLFVINQLKRLRRAGIPLIIIPGSHDMSVDGTFITVLEKVGLLRNAGKSDNFTIDGDYFLMKGEEVGNAVVYGVPGRRDNILEMYKSIKPAPSTKAFKIFMFHHIVTDVKGTESFADIPMSALPYGMDYYAGGHWHEHEELKYNAKPVVYPGSTEYGDVDALEKHLPRGFIHYRDKPVFVKLNTRDVKVLDINCNSLSPGEVARKCISSIEKSNDGLLIVKLSGTLKSGKRGEVDTVLINEAALSNGYIHCNIRISDLLNPGEKVSVSTANKTIEELEHEFLKSKGYASNEVIIARQLIDVLGRDYKPEELAKALKKAEGLL